jgi:uncharacterized protein YpiB (UPF0302 family)
MNKRLSHADNMKNSGAQKQKEKKAALKDMYSQMILDEAWFNVKREELLVDIDGALDDRDYEKFMKLTNQYKKLMKNW